MSSLVVIGTLVVEIKQFSFVRGPCTTTWSKHYMTLCSKSITITLREKCPYSDFFWPSFSRIRIEYGEIRNISPYSVWTRGNADQNNSEYVHFLRSVSQHFTKYGGNKLCDTRDKMVLVCHVILQDHVIKRPYDFVSGRPL